VATLVEPLSLDKSHVDEAADMELIKSVIHLAETNVPSFRHIERDASASKVVSNIEKIAGIIKGSKEVELPTKQEILQYAIESKIQKNVSSINELVKDELNKALMAGYGGAGKPTSLTAGGVFQSESLEDGRAKDKSFKYVTCDDCGKEQIYSKYQVKCRDCGKSFPMEKLHKLFLGAIAT
jgi:hypothetical protein